MFGIKTAWEMARGSLLADEITKMSNYVSMNFCDEEIIELDEKTISIYIDAVKELGSFEETCSKDMKEYANHLRRLSRRFHGMNPIISYALHRVSAYLECLVLPGDEALLVVGKIEEVIKIPKKEL